MLVVSWLFIFLVLCVMAECFNNKWPVQSLIRLLSFSPKCCSTNKRDREQWPAQELHPGRQSSGEPAQQVSFTPVRVCYRVIHWVSSSSCLLSSHSLSLSSVNVFYQSHTLKQQSNIPILLKPYGKNTLTNRNVQLSLRCDNLNTNRLFTVYIYSTG